MSSIRELIVHLLRRSGRALALFALSFTIGPAVFAATYYVGPNGGNNLSTTSLSPGSLGYAVANAPSGSTVILENGTYDGSPSGFTVGNSNVSFQAQSWHGAIVKNSTGSDLWGPAGASVTNDVCQGIVFGPSTGLGWSGGGGANWQFLDCVFTQNGGVGAGSHSLFQHCLFTDAYSNSFDIGGSETDLNTGVIFKNCIVRRGNRSSADDDSVGNKEDFIRNTTFDGLVVYDNNGTALWFDTDNDGWVIKNSTFFANHGGNDWYYCGVASGISATHFTGTGQDGQSVSVGQPIKCISGTLANIGHTSVITAFSGNNPQTITISPALPATPAANDQFIVQQDDESWGDGFTTEANDNGTYIDNVAYSNTDRGFYDHASGGTAFGGTGGLIIENNLFAYNGEGFDYWPDGRDDGAALVEHNRFKFHPGSSMAFGSGGGALGRYAGPLQISFDYNVYDPDNSRGDWARWYAGNPAAIAGGLTDGSQPKGEDYLQDPATWNMDQNSLEAKVAFWGTPPTAYVWPAREDKNWSDVYFPNSKFGLSKSIHQIDDTDGAVNNTIDAALAGHRPGDIVFIPVVAHMPISGTACEVYDLNGRWVTLSVSLANQAAFLADVPPYVTCVPGNKTTTYKIRVKLSSVDPYGMAATYSQSSGNAPAAPVLLTATPGDTQASLVWSPVPSADSYDIYRVTRSQSESSAPVATGITATSYTDNGPADGTPCYYKVAAVNSYGSSAESNELSVAPHDANGSLIGSEITASTSTYDLTSLGTIDWRQWGDMGGTNDKATGGGLISDLTQIGGGKYGRWDCAKCHASWTDSVLGARNNSDQSFLWCNTAQNAGWTFTVPADTTVRTLNVLWGGAYGTAIKLNARLSDSSAPEYTATQNLPGSDGSAFFLDTITYNSEKPGQTLTITLTKTDANAGPSIDLLAAWLR